MICFPLVINFDCISIRGIKRDLIHSKYNQYLSSIGINFKIRTHLLPLQSDTDIIYSPYIWCNTIHTYIRFERSKRYRGFYSKDISNDNITGTNYFLHIINITKYHAWITNASDNVHFYSYSASNEALFS